MKQILTRLAGSTLDLLFPLECFGCSKEGEVFLRGLLERTSPAAGALLPAVLPTWNRIALRFLPGPSPDPRRDSGAIHPGWGSAASGPPAQIREFCGQQLPNWVESWASILCPKKITRAAYRFPCRCTRGRPPPTRLQTSRILLAKGVARTAGIPPGEAVC